MQTVELSLADPSLAGDGQSRGAGPDPLIGKELLHYRVVEVIGQGGMSVVYRGYDAHLHRDVAIKVLHPFLAEKAECRARLAREARAVARLEHPHILKVFDFSGDPATLDERPESAGGRNVRGFAEGFIVAELVRGPTLKHFVEDHSLWKCPELGAMIVWQIAEALQHAHENGVVHRDIKPENVMVREDGCLKLMDFGIAHIADQNGLTITGTLLGSPAHMAPECIDGHAADERSDVFSLGTCLYWLTTGELPFEALTPHALLKQIVEGRSIPAQQRSPRVSNELARVLAKAMATRREERYQTARELVVALEELLAKSGVPADAERLRTALAAPERELPGFVAAVRAAHLQRAEQLLQEAAPVRALACLSRVLADDKDDAVARALVERAQGEIEAEPPPAPPAPQEAVAIGKPLPSAAVVTEELPPHARLRPLLRQGALVVLAAGLIGAAVVVATRFDDGWGRARGEPVPPAPAPVDEPTSSDETTSALVDKATAVPEPKGPARADPGLAPAIVGPKPNDKPDDGKGAHDDKRDVGRVVPVAPPRVELPSATPAPDANAGTRPVRLWAKPWADMYVDGVKVASGKKAEVNLSVGTHVVRFTATGAKDEEKTVVVSADEPVPDVKVQLEPQPAYLAVACNVPDAFVQVAGQGGKAANETQEAAMVVPIETSRARLEVTVFKKGFTPYVKRVEFQAGQTMALDVVLQPEPNVGPAPVP